MDKDQFITVIRENQKLIFKISYSYCRNEEYRKDLEQEILLQLWRSFAKFDGRVKISTWIYRIALNTAISFFRSNDKYSNRRADLDESIISTANLDREIENDEHIKILFLFIDQLNEFDKALILLYLDEIKYKDIASILGITETNVATKISRIKENLKTKFHQN